MKVAPLHALLHQGVDVVGVILCKNQLKHYKNQMRVKQQQSDEQKQRGAIWEHLV